MNTNDSGSSPRVKRWVAAVVAVGLLLAVGVLLGRLLLSKPGYHRQGPLVWIDSKAYVEANWLLNKRERSVPPSALVETPDGEAPPLGNTGLTAAARANRSIRTLAPGQTLKTGAQPCRVLLGEGQVAYLNHDTVLTLECADEVTLGQGEIYLEISKMAPARPNPAGHNSMVTGGDLEPGFVVNTPGREIITRTARFDVRVKGEATRLIVFHGLAFANDDQTVVAGQQYDFEDSEEGSTPHVTVVPRPIDTIAWTRDLMGDGGSPAAELEPGIGSFFSSVHQGARYLLLRWRPDLPCKVKRGRHDWVFLVESSADRDPALARLQIEIVRDILDNAEPNDTFAVLTAGTFVQTFAPRRQAATPANAARAVRFLEQTHLFGALDLGRALAAAGPYLRIPKNPVLVHLGSGAPVLGERDADALVRQIPESARYVGIGVGTRWHRALMKAAAARTDGYFTRILPGCNIHWRTLELLAALDLPRLLDVRVTDRSGKLEFQCADATLAWGESLRAIARLDATSPMPSSVEVSGLFEGTLRRWIVPVTRVAETRHDLSAVWAQLKPAPMAAPKTQPLAKPLQSALAAIPRGLFADCQAGLMQSCMLSRAERLLGPLLEDVNWGRWPWLWRLAATLSDRRGRITRAVFCWERALELQYGDWPAGVDVERVRRDFGWLLEQYPKLSAGVATDRAGPPRDLVERVIHAADRWRRLDPDPVWACQTAARALRELGAADVAREYSTTPLATAPETP